MLIECAKAARKTPDSFFSAQYQRISVRRGKNRATVAVAHSILIAIYHVLRDGVPFVDLGSDFFAWFGFHSKMASRFFASVTSIFPKHKTLLNENQGHQ